MLISTPAMSKYTLKNRPKRQESIPKFRREKKMMEHNKEKSLMKIHKSHT